MKDNDFAHGRSFDDDRDEEESDDDDDDDNVVVVVVVVVVSHSDLAATYQLSLQGNYTIVKQMTLS